MHFLNQIKSSIQKFPNKQQQSTIDIYIFLIRTGVSTLHWQFCFSTNLKI